jgi:hypothetical protein
MTKAGLLATAMLGAIVAGGGPAATRPAQPQAGGEGPIVYWISVETATFAPWPNSLPNAATQVRRFLQLELASPRRPDGRAAAEHLVPPELGLGPAIRLVTLARMPPVPAPAPVHTLMRTEPSARPGQVHVYWGCGEHVRRGQPLILNIADAQRGRTPPAVATRPFTPMTPPDEQSAATFGQWSSLNNRIRFPDNASLVGAHGLRGNYLPEIRFALAPGQDFLAPIAVTANRAGTSGAVPLRWRRVVGARAYFVTATQLTANGALVWWTSSEAPFSNLWPFDYLATADVEGLLRRRMLLPARRAACTVPAEIVRRSGSTVVNINALGPVVDLGGPSWSVKLRTRATYTGKLGQ